MSPEEFDALSQQYRSAGFTIAGEQSAAMLKVARDSLAASAEAGLSARAASSAMQDALVRSGYGALEPYHAELVARMSYSTAYGHAQWTALKDPKVAGLIPYFRYLQVQRPTKREAHAPMHNKFFRRDDPIWLEWWPPNGYNCECRVVGVSINTVRTYRIEADPWPKMPRREGGRQFRVHPDDGFRGNPGREIRTAAGSHLTRAVRKARSAGRRTQ